MKTILIFSFMLYSLVVPNQDVPKEIIRIMNSGNGRTIETAFEVYTVEEEYKLLRFLKLTPIIQKLDIKNGYFYDAIQTKNNTIYFKIIKRQLPKKAKTKALIL
jgi:hypothetical protein